MTAAGQVTHNNRNGVADVTLEGLVAVDQRELSAGTGEAPVASYRVNDGKKCIVKISSTEKVYIIAKCAAAIKMGSLTGAKPGRYGNRD